jgi:large subunit ribosomal protein L18
MDRNRIKTRGRQRRRRRVRKRVLGTPQRPRLSVFRSAAHIYAQIVDDLAGRTLASASTRDRLIADPLKSTGNRTAAAAVGQAIAERARAAHIERVVFDRGGYKYHGRVRELAEAARKAGLDF